MKKSLIVLITLALILVFAGCSANTTDQKDEGITTSNTTVPTQPNLEQTTDAKTTADHTSSSAHLWTFYSVRDLDTYIRTGSTDPEDYCAPLLYELDEIFPAEIIRYYGYVPLSDYFSFDETEFEHVKAGFVLQDGVVTYCYLLDGIQIIIKQVDNCTSTVDYYTKTQQMPTINNDSTASDPNKNPNQTYEVKKCGDYDVVYHMENGTRKHATIVIDNYYIRIDVLWLGKYDSETLEQKFSTVMTSPKYAAFSALFSDDQETFEAAVMGMAQPKGEVE